MRRKNNLFERIPNSLIFLTIATIFFLQIVTYLLSNSGILKLGLGGGSDANYYDRYATGVINNAVNFWPVILRYLNHMGLYSRDVISSFLFFLNLLIIPIITTRISGLDFKVNQKYYLYSYLLCLSYPTIFFYSLDVYRDVFMVFVFLIGSLLVKRMLNSSNFVSFLFLFFLSASIGVFLLSLRPYLGYSFLLAMFLWKIEFTKKRLFFFSVLYFSALFLLNYLGFLDSLTEYRSGFEEIEGGSTLGLDFSNPIMFVPNFILSTLGQLFGLYITNPFSIVLLIIETIPVFLMVVYIVKNIKLLDSFGRFLIIFFVIYASIWLIGNDNLGTAVRLRIYNYLVIYICFFYILRTKKHKSFIG